jgi:thiol-disulfide isomerase/thioredoxin
LAIGFVCLVAAWAGYEAGRPGTEPPPPGNASTAQALQQILTTPLADLTGQPHTLAETRGKLRVINFWAAWCPPCRAEMPAFSRIQQKFAENDVKFTGVAIDEVKPVQAFLDTTPVSYPILLAPTALLALSAALGNGPQGLPFTFILDQQDRIVAQKLGQWQETDLANTLAILLAKP